MTAAGRDARAGGDGDAERNSEGPAASAGSATGAPAVVAPVSRQRFSALVLKTP